MPDGEVIKDSETKYGDVERYWLAFREIVNIELFVQDNDSFHNALMNKYKIDWRKLCAALDVGEDAQRAIDYWNTKIDDNIDFVHGENLFLYGLLNALYMQQEAVRELYHIVFDKTLDFKKDYPNTFKVRDIRDSVEHAPFYKNQRASIFISPTTVKKHSFDYLIFAKDKAKPQIVHVSIKKCILEQGNDIKKIVTIICKEICSMITTKYQKQQLQSILSKYDIPKENSEFIMTSVNI